ncbi:putative Monocarboxylate transporter 9 [Hypsibius exemplaris]|uniref:Monocarboxylate transporter 9 n=1 Tax=Hypsibius exemplaris TaxID=2072580 RepID=A0A1W0X4E8_HYPEX|nr:putative Monocarboxylate transporter 9 [Hypsibius exemplaris]
MEMASRNGGDKKSEAVIVTTARNRRDSAREEEDVDGGWAWVVLVASFVVNSISLGSNFAFGVFLPEWVDYFGEGPTKTSMLISMSCALVLATAPLASILSNRFGARSVILVGGFLTSTGFAASYFAPNFWTLFFAYGIVTGLGNGLSYSPSFGVLPLYFRKRRNFATAIVTAGNGVGIVIFSALFRYLITHYTWRGAMLITAGIALHIVPCGLCVFKRQPRTVSTTFRETAALELFTEPEFYVSLLHSALMGSQYIFIVFCVQYARLNNRLAPEDTALILTSMGVTNIVGRTLVAVVSTVPALATSHKRFIYLSVMSLAVAVSISMYPLTKQTNLTTLCFLAGLVGLSWGTKFSLVPGIQMDLLRPARFNVSWGYIAFVLGVAFFAFPPLASEIAKATGNGDNAFYFAGAMSGLAFLTCPVLHFLWWRRRRAAAPAQVRKHSANGAP